MGKQTIRKPPLREIFTKSWLLPEDKSQFEMPYSKYIHYLSGLVEREKVGVRVIYNQAQYVMSSMLELFKKYFHCSCIIRLGGYRAGEEVKGYRALPSREKLESGFLNWRNDSLLSWTIEADEIYCSLRIIPSNRKKIVGLNCVLLPPERVAFSRDLGELLKRLHGEEVGS